MSASKDEGDPRETGASPNDETVVDQPTPLEKRDPAPTVASPREIPTQHPADDQPTAATHDGSRIGAVPGGGSGTGAGSSSRPARDASPSGGTRGGATRIDLESVISGRYRIVGVLGEGGMGVVYKAHDLELDRHVALKTIRSDMARDPSVVQRFKRELLLSQKVTHKNVVRIYDLADADGVKFFTMEFIEGKSLKDVIRERAPLSAPEVTVIAREILSALAEAHRQGVVHRDLKPQNVMIDPAGVPRLMDFGIARSSMETSGITGTGMMMGTPDYMSPEQVRADEAGPQSDLFSFGVILYELLTGDLPYAGDTPLSKVMSRLTNPPRALAPSYTKSVPKYLESIAFKCMERDLDLRYSSAEEILQDLDREQVDRSLTLKVQKAVSRRKWAVLGTAAAVLAALGMGFWANRDAASGGTGGAATDGDAAVAGPIRTLAIVPFTNSTGSEALEWMRSGIPDMLVTDLSQSQYVRPISSERVLKVMRDIGVADQTRFDEAALEAVSKRASADNVLFGQFIQSGDAIRLDLTLRRAGTGVPEPLSVTGDASDVFDIVDRISREVKGRLDLTDEQLRGDSDRPIADVSTGSIEAVLSYHRGLSELRQGALQAAMGHLVRATRVDPKFAMAFAKLAEAQLQVGQYREAEATIEQAQRLSEQGSLPLAERYQIHATAALVGDDFETAVASLVELEKLYPHDPDLALSLAQAYEELGQLPEALAAYRKAAELAPDYGAVYLGLGRTQVMIGQSPAAIVSLRQAVDSGQFQEDLDAMGMIHSILGVAHREIGELDQALVELEKSMDYRERAEDPRGQAATYFNMAAIYEFKGDITKALAAENEALDIYRSIGDLEGQSVALNSMGITYRTAGDLDKALEAFRDSHRVEMERQDHAMLGGRLNNIADIYRLKGEHDTAIVYLDQAKTNLAQSEDLQAIGLNHLFFGLVRRAQGRYDLAIEAFLEAMPIFQEIEQEAGVADCLKNLGELYMTQGRYADALSALERSFDTAVDLQVGDDIKHAGAPLARLYLLLGQDGEAERTLSTAEEALAHDHGAGHADAVTLFGRAELADARGEEDAAAKAYEDANYQANISKEKEVAVESRIALGRLYLRQGNLPNAERLLERTREEAKEGDLRPLEAEAAAALAEVYVARGNPEAARQTALESVDLAKDFDARPTLFRAQWALARALDALGQTAAAKEAFGEASEHLEWIRGGLRPEHVQAFNLRPEVRAFVERAGSS